MHKIKDREDGEVPNDVKFVTFLWKVGAKVSGGNPNVQSARSKKNLILHQKLFFFFIFKLL